MKDLKSSEHKQKWFESFLYIFNLRWDKVDNFRIDKFLMLLRMMFSQVLSYLKSASYDSGSIHWYEQTMVRLFSTQSMGDSASGIALQICDIFVQELNKVDKHINLDKMASVLKPFLELLATL